MLRIIVSLATAFFMLLGPLATAVPLTVKVDSRSGAPCITVNNKPVRARVFYGQPAAGLLSIKAGPQMVKFDFTATQSAIGDATMHFRLGQTPGDFYIDNITVVDAQTGENACTPSMFEGGITSFNESWSVWPLAEANTVGTVTVEPNAGQDGTFGVHVNIKQPPTNTWPDFHIYHSGSMVIKEGHTYHVSFWMKSSDARSIKVEFYRPGDIFMSLGGPEGHFESQVKLAASAGVDFVSTAISLPWPKPGEAEDWKPVDAILNTAIKSNPNVLLIPRIGVYAPDWWNKQHPDELMKWEKGNHPQIASPASTVFLQEASVRMKLLIEHLESTFGDRIAGYHPNGQNTGEWFYMDSWEPDLNGYSRCDRDAFRKWLQNKYKTDAALQKAWHNSSVRLVSCEVPSAARRHMSPGGIFRDPNTEQDIIDFVAFQNESMANTVNTLARVVKTTAKNRKLVLMFYGYLHEFGAMSTGSGSSGHYSLRQILDCPYIDIVCSPISYFDRGRGQSGPSMTAAESVTLAGKMWLNEDDTRTYLTTEEKFPGAEHVLKDAAQTNELLKRNVGQEAVRNFATWWMDLPASGWFDDPVLWTEMKKMDKLDQYFLKKPIAYHPEIALVTDLDSMKMLSNGADKVAGPLVSEVRRELSRIGAPYGSYLLDDVVAGRVKAKMYVFCAAYKLNAQQRSALKKATKGSMCIWAYAPGYFDGSKVSLESMQQLTGFKLKPVRLDKAYATPVAKEIAKSIFFVRSEQISPLFAVTDAKPSEVKAVYSDKSPAVAVRKSGASTSVFWGTPGWNRTLLRSLANTAGVHLYAPLDCIAYANGDVLVLHATKDCPVQINTGKEYPVYDIMTGEFMGNGPVLKIELKYSQTRLLKIGPMN